jgi:hypothetical protein
LKKIEFGKMKGEERRSVRRITMTEAENYKHGF